MIAGKRSLKAKLKHTIPDMEIVVPRTEYAFTLNPTDQYQHFRAQDRVKDFINDVKRLLQLSYNIKYVLYIELSPKGRLHLHGTIEFKDETTIYNWYLKHLRYLMHQGTVCIKPITDYDKWIIYCDKQHGFHKYIQKQYVIDVCPIRIGLFIDRDLLLTEDNPFIIEDI